MAGFLHLYGVFKSYCRWHFLLQEHPEGVGWESLCWSLTGCSIHSPQPDIQIYLTIISHGRTARTSTSIWHYKRRLEQPATHLKHIIKEKTNALSKCLNLRKTDDRKWIKIFTWNFKDWLFLGLFFLRLILGIGIESNYWSRLMNGWKYFSEIFISFSLVRSRHILRMKYFSFSLYLPVDSSSIFFVESHVAWRAKRTATKYPPRK